jgi:membrane protein YqaA with SNARE-associated domain
MAEDLVLNLGYVGLFIVCYLSATIIPFSGEAALAVLLVTGYPAGAVLLTAVLANALGAMTNYLVGAYAMQAMERAIALPAWLERLRPSPSKLALAQRLFRRFGTPALALTFVPLLGDALTFAAGAAKVNGVVFLALVFAGRILRYALVFGGLGTLGALFS